MTTLRPLLLASDHAGFELKERLKAVLDRRGIAYRDAGTHSSESVDYPDYARRVAGAISRGEADRGVLVCGTGQGMAMTANRFPGVRAALPFDEETARLSREHNDANVLALGGRVVDPERAERILTVWLETPFAGGRHAKRVAKIDSESEVAAVPGDPQAASPLASEAGFTPARTVGDADAAEDAKTKIDGEPGA